MRIVIRKWMAFVWLSAVSITAAEIVAWKVPLKSICPEGLSSKEISRRVDLPEKTVFFAEKDELWDVRLKDDPKCPGSLEGLNWLVWNETSGRFVARGGWGSISVLHEMLGPESWPRYCKVKIDLHAINSAEAGRVAVPIPAPELLIESGHRIETKWSRDGITFEIDADAEIDTWGPLADLRLFCNVKVPGQPSMLFNTSFLLVEGKRLLIVRDEDGAKGLELGVTGTWVTAEGEPLAEQVLIQSEGKPSPLFPLTVDRLREVKGFGWLSSVGLAPAGLLELLKQNKGEKVPAMEADPFAASSERVKVRFPGNESIRPPDCIRPWIKHELLDAKSVIRELEMPIPIPEFAGYDPIMGRFYFFDNNEEIAGDHRSYLLDLDADSIMVHHCGVSIEGRGSSYLIARTGQRATLSRNIGGAVLRDCELEPMYSESGELTDLRLEWNDRHADGETHLKTSTTLKNGKPQEVLSGFDGKPGLRVKSELISP